MEAGLNNLVIDSVLLDKTTARWCHAAGEPFLTHDTWDLVVLADIYVQGFGIPTHPFLRGLLQYYQIALCHLNPNSILHITIFINLCKAFLGISPHFNLFHHLFCLKTFSSKGSPKVVGGVYLQLWDGMVK